MAGPIDVVGKAADGSLAIVIPEAAVAEARHQLWEVGQAITARTFVIEGESLHVTPMIGFAPFDDISGTTLSQRVATALSHAATHLDLEPFRWVSGLEPVAALGAKPSSWVWQDLLGLPAQLGLSVLLALVVPFFVYVAAYNSGHDIVPAMYFLVLAGLLVTATLIWIECFMAMKRSDPPEFNGNYPAAVGIIAAYLPNEAATIVETISAFLASDYPGPYEVILAYNTSRSLPVESTLRRMARKDPRFRPIRVRGSTSKAQNVNYAVGQTRAEMIGVFDADHHPEPGSFARAWRWLAAGNDVVQGHCLIRNGSESWVSRTAAVEFELMYAVSHPGRARLHGFGLFGGSNGFWRAHLLRQTRMHGFMLTEDIDSSMRVIETGGKIVSDPFLISRELAPTTLQALWNQRLRWAQGWFEVSIRHTWKALVSTHLTRRQKLGVLHLMSWRELYPWLSVQMYPIIAFWAWRLGGPQRIHWLVPIFVLTTVFTVGTGPTQALVAYLLAHPDVRAHRGWFWWYMGVSVVFYTSFRNLIAVVGQAKHMRGDRQWKVTPRSPGVGST
jgi:cellulose synthase/poly-beta-1,6-N-acetylglucosamine synthase-like glycosyltransferase